LTKSLLGVTVSLLAKYRMVLSVRQEIDGELMTYETIYFVYDGECPICQMGADLYELRQSVGELLTVDARTQLEHPVLREVNQAGLDLDVGMVIKYRGQLYQGKEALRLMALLGAGRGWFNRLVITLYRFKFITWLSYPFMKGARNFALKLKGVGQIRNLGPKP